jgi:hypothetical protein
MPLNRFHTTFCDVWRKNARRVRLRKGEETCGKRPRTHRPHAHGSSGSLVLWGVPLAQATDVLTWARKGTALALLRGQTAAEPNTGTSEDTSPRASDSDQTRQK